MIPSTPHATIDFETYSEASLKVVGAWAYAENWSTDIICLRYWFPDQEPWDRPYGWRPGMPAPKDLFAWIEQGGLVEAHNAGFEQAIWLRVCVERLGWPAIPVEQWRDSMAAALHKALPADLDTLGTVLDVQVRKDKIGKQLIDKLSVPQKLTKTRRSIRTRDEALEDQMADYCATDVLAEVEVSAKLGPLPPDEQKLWFLDQRINRRGLAVDVPFIYKAQEITRRAQVGINKELEKLTGGAVEAVTQGARMLEWINREAPHLAMTSLAKHAVADALGEDEDDGDFDEDDFGCAELPEHVAQALKLRRAGAKTSTKKLDRLLQCICRDGRVRGLIQYHGAATGRWAGRLVQPQNLPRPREGHDIDHDFILGASFDEIAERFGDVLPALADHLRGVFIPGPGNGFAIQDYSGIEARVVPILTGENVLVQRLHDPALDLYCAGYKDMYGVEIAKKTHPNERQQAKTIILAGGYQGGLGAYRQMERSLGVKTGLSDEEVLRLVKAWRKANKNIVKGWYDTEDAALLAVANPGKSFYACMLEWFMRGDFLICRVPSGGELSYFKPSIGHDKERDKPKLQFWGFKQIGKGQRKWQQLDTYGGKLIQNATERVARDLMVNGMHKAEEAGFPVVMLVHDELVAEPTLTSGLSPSLLGDCMCDLPDWARGWPIAAAGENELLRRYSK